MGTPPCFTVRPRWSTSLCSPTLVVTGNHSGCYVHLPDINQRYAECVDADLPVSELKDEPWGMREFRLTDPSGNVLRIGCGRWPILQHGAREATTAAARCLITHVPRNPWDTRQLWQ